MLHTKETMKPNLLLALHWHKLYYGLEITITSEAKRNLGENTSEIPWHLVIEYQMYLSGYGMLSWIIEL